MGLFQGVEEKIRADYYFHRLASLGDVYELKVFFEPQLFLNQLERLNPKWVPYNKSKTWSNRYGLSLFSLNGETSGEIDLNSIKEWNEIHGTDYHELSFKTPTEYWKSLEVISGEFNEVEKHIGRSHLLKLSKGGIFPPHRDNYRETDRTFRLISLINESPKSMHLIVDDKLARLRPYYLYFLNTRKVHSVVSFEEDTYLLVLNMELCEQTLNFVHNRITEP
jgi:hypothetical protein